MTRAQPQRERYLATLEATLVAHVIHPFAGHRAAEIVASPKVYGFDTGFVCYQRGWHTLRRDDLGLLWERLVLKKGCGGDQRILVTRRQ